MQKRCETLPSHFLIASNLIFKKVPRGQSHCKNFRNSWVNVGVVNTSVEIAWSWYYSLLPLFRMDVLLAYLVRFRNKDPRAHSPSLFDKVFIAGVISCLHLEQCVRWGVYSISQTIISRTTTKHKKISAHKLEKAAWCHAAVLVRIGDRWSWIHAAII